jgi:hypothetical protein
MGQLASVRTLRTVVGVLGGDVFMHVTLMNVSLRGMCFLIKLRRRGDELGRNMS